MRLPWWVWLIIVLVLIGLLMNLVSLANTGALYEGGS